MHGRCAIATVRLERIKHVVESRCFMWSIVLANNGMDSSYAYRLGTSRVGLTAPAIPIRPRRIAFQAMPSILSGMKDHIRYIRNVGLSIGITIITICLAIGLKQLKLMPANTAFLRPAICYEAAHVK